MRVGMNVEVEKAQRTGQKQQQQMRVLVPIIQLLRLVQYFCPGYAEDTLTRKTPASEGDKEAGSLILAHSLGPGAKEPGQSEGVRVVWLVG